MKFRACEVPPAQSAVVDAEAEDAALLPNVTDCDCGGLKTVTLTIVAVARSSAAMVAFS